MKLPWIVIVVCACCWANLFGTVFVVQADSTVILPPISGNEGAPQKLLVMIIGANVAPAGYVSLMKQIQAETPLRLWIGIPDFLGHFPDPLTVKGHVTDIIATVKEQGFSSITNQDVWMAGHSLGGIIAKGAEPGLGLAGLLLFASYLDLDDSKDLANWEGPVLTLGGEVDGLTRITRIAEEYQQFQSLIQSNASLVTLKPVVVLPGVSHSQFCSVRVKGDNPPYLNISLAKAQQLIGQVVADFLVANVFPSSSPEFHKARRDLVGFISATTPLVSSFIKAQGMEKTDWCLTGQQVIANLSTTNQHRVSVTETVYTSIVSFANSKPSLSTNSNSVDIQTTNYNTYELNPFDVSTVRVSADDLDCKMKSQAAILKALGISSAGSEGDCRGINTVGYSWALKAVTPTQQARYYKYGKQLQFLPDTQYDTGFTWLLSSVGVEQSGSNPNVYTVTSTALQTGTDVPFDLGGMHYCKLFSPARAVEWILVDSLK